MPRNATVYVWDPLVRLFHWGLVAAFAVAWFTAEEESAWHIYSGYTVMGLIIFRLVWGFVGTAHARFSDFVYGPAAVIEYVRGMKAGHPRRYLGHNPLGGWMIVAMLATLAVVTYSGLVVYAIEENAGPLAGIVAADTGAGLAPGQALIGAARAGDDDNDEDEEPAGSEASEAYWEEIHEAATNLMLVFIALHLLGVAWGSLTHKENLARAMITGRKRTDEDEGASR